MKISKSVRSAWDNILSGHEVQGLRNEAGTLTWVPEEYGQLRILHKSETLSKQDLWLPEGGESPKMRPELPELVVAGYASPQVIDKESHLITKEALSSDLPRFLAHPHYRNVNVVHCAVAGTRVLMRGGRYRAIEKVRPGAYIWTHRRRVRRVLATTVHLGPAVLVRVELENGVTLRLTEKHRLLTTGGWVMAGKLTTDHVLNHLVKVGHRSRKLADPQKVVDGMGIKSVLFVPNSEPVYNLEVEDDNSYAGDGCIHHNTNIQVGEILPEWTHPETGEVYKTKVDDVGLFAVAKIRTDPFRPAIVDKVIEDIESGELAAFSISGDAPYESRQHKCSDGTCFWVINEIEFYEITLLVTEDTQVDVPGGRKPIGEVAVGDEVISGRRRPQVVTQTGKVAFDGEVIEIEEEDGSVVRLSPEHKVRARKAGKKKYTWIPAGELEPGDTVVTRGRVPVRNRRGGIKTAAGRARQVAGVTSDEFRRKRSEIMKMKWADPHYRAAALARLEESLPERKKGFKKDGPARAARMRKLRQDPAFNEAMFKSMRMAPNRVEKKLQKKLGPLGFWFTGDGKLVTKSGLVPDFHNGDGHVVELFGDYWHEGQNPNKRIRRLQQDGYRCLVLWEHEVKGDIEGCVRRVKEFCSG